MHKKIEEKFIRYLLFNSSSCPPLKSIDLDKLVKLASSHLLIPCLYSKLSKSSIRKNLPKDFINYIKNIYQINKERNKTLIKEISEISEIFNKNNVNHVFLKGSANLISNLYEDIGERMVGDIDILVKKNQIAYANNLLKDNGYFENKIKLFIVVSTSHYPRHKKKNKVFAVELHSEILELNNSMILKPSEILRKKIQFRGIWVPNITDQYLSNIYNFQINDRGFYKLSYNYRTIYDAFLINKKNQINIEKETYDKFLNAFFMICNELNIYIQSEYKKNKMKLIRFRLKDRVKFYSIIDYYFINESYKLKFRFQQVCKFLSDKNYRKYLAVKYLDFKNQD